METLLAILGDTEDATIVKSASAEKITRTAGPSGSSVMQSGASRAWGMSGDVD